MNTRRILTLTCALFLLCAPLGAGAQTNTGQMEVSVAGNYTMVDDVDIDVLVLNGRFGYFFTDAIAAGVGGQYYGVSGDADVDYYSLNFDGRYHFLTGTEWVPYAGGEVGISLVDSDSDDETGYQLGLGAGVKYFFMEDASLFAEYKHYLLFLGGDDTSLDMLNFGLSVLF